MVNAWSFLNKLLSPVFRRQSNPRDVYLVNLLSKSSRSHLGIRLEFGHFGKIFAYGGFVFTINF